MLPLMPCGPNIQNEPGRVFVSTKGQVDGVFVTWTNNAVPPEGHYDARLIAGKMTVVSNDKKYRYCPPFIHHPSVFRGKHRPDHQTVGEVLRHLRDSQGINPFLSADGMGTQRHPPVEFWTRMTDLLGEGLAPAAVAADDSLRLFSFLEFPFDAPEAEVQYMKGETPCVLRVSVDENCELHFKGVTDKVSSESFTPSPATTVVQKVPSNTPVRFEGARVTDAVVRHICGGKNVEYMGNETWRVWPKVAADLRTNVLDTRTLRAVAVEPKGAVTGYMEAVLPPDSELQPERDAKVWVIFDVEAERAFYIDQWIPWEKAELPPLADCGASSAPPLTTDVHTCTVGNNKAVPVNENLPILSGGWTLRPRHHHLFDDGDDNFEEFMLS